MLEKIAMAAFTACALVVAFLGIMASRG